MHTRPISRVQLYACTSIIYTALNRYIVSISHSLSASLIPAGGKGLAGHNLNDLQREDCPEVLTRSRRLYKLFARKQLERTANRGSELFSNFLNSSHTLALTYDLQAKSARWFAHTGFQTASSIALVTSGRGMRLMSACSRELEPFRIVLAGVLVPVF